MPTSKLNYEAQVESHALTAPAKLDITPDGVALTTPFNPVFIPFADVTAFSRAGQTAVIATGYDRFTISRLGSLLDAFYLELYATFDVKVGKALFVASEPDFETEGVFHYTEAGREENGQARVRVYADCIGVFPPDDRARRIPFAFAVGMRTGSFELSLMLDGGDTYDFLRLGRDQDAFAACVTAKLHAYRENAIDAVRALDTSLRPAALTAIAAKMPQGVAVAMGELASIAPTYVAALEASIATTKAADTYAALQTMCTPGDICVGMKTGLAGEDKDNILWMIAPSATKPVAAVEFAVAEETAAATFVYRIAGDRTDFVRRLNRAMEAIDFHREVISMSEDDLNRSENDHYAMAVRRTAALRFMRENLLGRVIHASLDSWTSDVRGYLT